MPVTNVLGSTIFHVERGEGAAFIFLHGNPTSSHVWRNVLPALDGLGLLLAPDLIGMGKSGKPDIAYSFDDQARYLAAWIDALDPANLSPVGHRRLLSRTRRAPRHREGRRRWVSADVC